MEMNTVPVTFSPHPLTAQGRQQLGVLWEDGRTIREHLIAAGVDLHREVVIFHNDRLLTVSEWDVVCPRPGDLINVEAVVSGGDDSNPLATILSIAVMVFAPELTTALVGINGAAALGSFGVTMVTAAIAIGGNLLISSLFRPSQASSATNSIAAESPTYSLAGGSNRMRPYEPLPVVMGNHRIFPDYGSKPYTEFEGDDQYLYQVFNFGLGNLVLSDLRIGETLLSTYSGVEITRAENGVLPGFWGNVDTSEGAALSNATGWITRTTGLDTTRISIDLVGTFYYANNKGGLSNRSASFELEYSVAGAGSWQPFIPTGLSAVTSYWSRGYWQNTITDPYYDGEGSYVPGTVTSNTWVQLAYDTNVSPSAHGENADGGSGTIWRYIPVGADPRPADSYASNTNALTLSGASTKPQRRTISRSVAPGQYDVRVRRTSADETDSKANSSVEWTVIRSYQEGVADYTGQTVLGIKIKASGQLNGALQQLSAHAVQNTWIWDGASWVFGATTNPAWWYLALARGMRDDDERLCYGGGLSDDQIDIEEIKAWALFCDTNALSFSVVLDQATNLADAMQTIARCGFASPSWASGKLGIVWDAPNQTPTMAFGMANIIKGTFEVAYVTDNLADEIVVNYHNRNKNWEADQVRVTVPGTVGTPTKPSTVDLMGCTTNAMAAKFANALAAQQTYRRRNITWETDFEGFVCKRGDVVLLSHDLTQWGYSGRLVSVAGNMVTLGKAVQRSGATEYLMVQSPDGEMEFFTLTAASGETDTLVLPTPLVLQSGYSAVDHKWYFSPLATPGKKVKITSVKPLSETRLRLTATDEYPEYYAAWNGVFTPPPSQTLLTQAGVSLSALTLTPHAMVVDNFQINRVTVAWRQRGEIESCTLTAWLAGLPYGTWTGIKGASHIIDLSQQTGMLIVEVTPIGISGPGAPVIGSINLSTLPAPEAPILTVTGGLFAVNASWTFGDEREDIRYTEIWFASTNNRANAARLTAQPYPAATYSHIGLQPGAGGYYWAKVIDTRGNPSAWYPSSPTAGLAATASADPSLLLDQLQEALGEDQLAVGLASRIDLIDGPATDVGTVANRIANLQGQIDAIAQTPDYDNTDTYSIGDVVKYNGGLYKAEQTTTGNLPTNTTYWTKIGDYSSLADAVAAHTSQIATLTGADASLSQSLTTLTARVTAAEGALTTSTAAIQNEATARATSDSALSSQISTVQATLNNNVAAVQTYAEAVAGDLGQVEARWGVKAQAMGDGVKALSGIELLSGSGGQSTVAVLADKFLVYKPDGSGAPKQVLSIGTVNGVQALGFDGSAIFDGTVVARCIDTRGLSIKDASGNVILAAGTPLAVSNITGLGLLATQNSVNWNTQISNIPGFGNFAWLSSITSANISSYIASGAIGTAYIADGNITTAKIADANVGTLKLAGNAVTVPVAASGTYDVSTAWADFGGGAVCLTISAFVDSLPTPGFSFNVYRDGSSLLGSYYVATGRYSTDPELYGGSRTIQLIDYPGAGSHYYRATGASLSILALGVKR